MESARLFVTRAAPWRKLPPPSAPTVDAAAAAAASSFHPSGRSSSPSRRPTFFARFCAFARAPRLPRYLARTSETRLIFGRDFEPILRTARIASILKEERNDALSRAATLPGKLSSDVDYAAFVIFLIFVSRSLLSRRFARLFFFVSLFARRCRLGRSSFVSLAVTLLSRAGFLLASRSRGRAAFRRVLGFIRDVLALCTPEDSAIRLGCPAVYLIIR